VSCKNTFINVDELDELEEGHRALSMPALPPPPGSEASEEGSRRSESEDEAEHGRAWLAQELRALEETWQRGPGEFRGRPARAAAGAEACGGKAAEAAQELRASGLGGMREPAGPQPPLQVHSLDSAGLVGHFATMPATGGRSLPEGVPSKARPQPIVFSDVGPQPIVFSDVEDRSVLEVVHIIQDLPLAKLPPARQAGAGAQMVVPVCAVQKVPQLVEAPPSESLVADVAVGPLQLWKACGGAAPAHADGSACGAQQGAAAAEPEQEPEA